MKLSALQSSIPQFPIFRRLDCSARADIEQYVLRFLPYSDFSFINLHCYDVRGDSAVSLLNGNLVVRMRDYVTLEEFHTFLGGNNSLETALTLLTLAKADGLTPVLHLVPEETVEAMNGAAVGFLHIAADEASFDYVYDTEELVALSGDRFKKKRRSITTFKRRFPDHHFSIVDLRDPEIIRGIKLLLDNWRDGKKRNEDDVYIEFSALSRCLAFAGDDRLVTSVVFDGAVLVAFGVNELAHRGFYIGHFGKAAPSCRGVGDFLEWETAKFMRNLGYTHMNLQQDLGIPGLRFAKRAWQPSSMLKKFTLTPWPALGFDQQ